MLLWVAVAMMTAVNVNAQEGYDDVDHEMAISFGGLSNSQWLDMLENTTKAVVGEKFNDNKAQGPFAIEYFYHLNNWLNVGAIFVYGHSNLDVYLGAVKPENHRGISKNDYFTLMPSVKANWLRKKNFGLYSKIAVGASLRAEKTEYDDGTDPRKNTSIHPNWQLSLVGFEAGSPYLRGFVELGVGEQGVALIGIRYKF